MAGGAAYSAPEVSLETIAAECGFAQSWGGEGRAGKLTYDTENNDLTI